MKQSVQLKNMPAMPNPSIERTHTGKALQALISFWALRALPARAAAGLTRIRRQLHPIDGKHLPSNQPLPITQKQHLRKELRNRLAGVTEKGGNRGEVRRGIARERNERHVLAAGTLNGSAADETA